MYRKHIVLLHLKTCCCNVGILMCWNAYKCLKLSPSVTHSVFVLYVMMIRITKAHLSSNSFLRCCLLWTYYNHHTSITLKKCILTFTISMCFVSCICCKYNRKWGTMYVFDSVGHLRCIQSFFSTTTELLLLLFYYRQHMHYLSCLFLAPILSKICSKIEHIFIPTMPAISGS